MDEKLSFCWRRRSLGVFGKGFGETFRDVEFGHVLEYGVATAAL